MNKSQDIPFPQSERYARWLIPGAIVCGLPLFILFAHEGDPLKGMVASLSAGSLVVIASTLWDLRSYLMFWVVFVVSMIFHVVLVWAVSGSDTHFPGIVLTPLVVVDFLFWQFVTVTAIRAVRN